MNEIAERITQRLHIALPGVSQAALARRIDMDPSALSRVMTGKRGLAGSEVVALASQLGVSTDWLLLGEDTFPIAIAARHEYENGTYSSSLDEKTMGLISGIALAYEQAGEMPTSNANAEVPTDPSEVRRLLQLKFGPDWPRHFADAVEITFGVDIVKADFRGQSGLSLKLPNATVVVVPTESFWGRQNFTIAHELWHVAHSHFAPLHGGASADGELAANNFASEVLLPEDMIRGIHWETVSEAALSDFIWQSGVSMLALTNRLSSFGLPVPALSDPLLMTLRRNIEVDDPSHEPVTSRRRDAAGRRFPTRLLIRHEILGAHPETLAWMLGAPLEAGEDLSALPEPADLDQLATLFGLST